MNVFNKALPLSLLALAALHTGCAHAGNGHKHHHGPGPGMHRGALGVSVVGVGEVKATPDIARTHVGVEVRAAQVDQATEAANQQMAAILAALKAVGVKDADLRTHSLSVNFEREYVPQPQPVVVVESGSGKSKATSVATASVEAPKEPQGFYRVSNMVEVTIRDLARASDVLTAATGAGANQLWGITFEVADTEPFVAQAREKAVRQARANAEQLAQLTGVTLGPVLTLVDGAVMQGTPGPMMAMRAEMSASKSAVPVERGELTVTHQVSVTYGLAPEKKDASQH